MKAVAQRAGTATALGSANTADVVFAEPWEARAFALAVTLSGGELFAWDDFRGLLIAEIAAGDAINIGEMASGGRAAEESDLRALGFNSDSYTNRRE